MVCLGEQLISMKNQMITKALLINKLSQKTKFLISKCILPIMILMKLPTRSEEWKRNQKRREISLVTLAKKITSFQSVILII